jgi:hypothetical protein
MHLHRAQHEKSHTNMGVTSGEWDAFMEDLVAPLEGFNEPAPPL